MDSQLNVLWRVRYGPFTAMSFLGIRAIAVDKSGNIIASGNAGTVKYDSDGRMQWESPEYGNILRLDRFGNVLISKQVIRDDGIYESEIIKFNADGTQRWRIRFHDDGLYNNSPTGLVIDKAGDIYLCTQNGEQSTIVKFVELGAATRR